MVKIAIELIVEDFALSRSLDTSPEFGTWRTGMEAPLFVRVLYSFQTVLTSAICSFLKKACFAFFSSEHIRFRPALCRERMVGSLLRLHFLSRELRFLIALRIAGVIQERFLLRNRIFLGIYIAKLC